LPDAVVVSRAASLLLTIEEIDAALGRIAAGTYGVYVSGGRSAALCPVQVTGLIDRVAVDPSGPPGRCGGPAPRGGRPRVAPSARRLRRVGR
jgi:hypothetical protein